MAALDPILRRLAALHPRVIDLSLDRVNRLLARMDHPEKRLPPTIHIAGTNGKGSLLAYLHHCLAAAGYRVHAYSSPHLVRMAERYRLAGRIIEEAYLEECLARAEKANDGAPITLFEIETAAGFLAFAETPADVLILETGLGGRLDATNVVDRPALVALTPISMDHQQYLGDDLLGIAAEKAAILKPGVPGIVGRQEPSVSAVIDKRAAEVGAPLFRMDREWSASLAGCGLVYESKGRVRRLPPPGLAGPHQIDNAGTALACLERLPGFDLPEAAIVEGLTNAVWPGRLQRLKPGPLGDLLPDGWELWLDGGHNPAAGEILADAISGWDTRPLHLVVGMLNSKDPKAFLAPLAPHAASLTAIAIPNEANTIDAETLAADARAAGFSIVSTALGPEAALRALADLDSHAASARAMFAGSLYLAGWLLAANDEAPT